MSKDDFRLRLRAEWKNGKLQKVLDQISQLSSINDDGAMGWSDFKIDVYFSIAYEAFESVDSVPGRELRRIIRKAIISLRKKDDLKVEKLKSETRKLIREYLQRNFVRFSTVTDIAIQLPFHVNLKRFRYRDVTLEVTKRVPRFMQAEIAPNASRTPYGASPNTRYAILVARCSARTESEAVSKSFDAISVFLGVTNLATKSWNIIGGEQRPQVLIADGPYKFVFREKIAQDSRWYNPSFKSEYWRSNSQDGEKFLKISAAVQKALKKMGEHPLRETLESVLVTTNEGIESHILSERMIYYWNAIERLFSKENEKIAYEKIIHRATFLENNQSEARLFLGHLAKMRNNKVHYGRSFDHQHQLLEYCVGLIRAFVFYLIFNGDDFKSHAEFLEMADLPSDMVALNRRRLAIERRVRFIETNRHREKGK